MKKLILSVLALVMAASINAQVTTPAPSPFSKVEQVVGLTDVSLEYSRPAMRGRTIFGDLVPFGKVWRTGANARTKVTFGDDVTVNETTLKAGTYAIFTIPQANQWEVVFYTEHAGGGAPQSLDEEKVAARVMADVVPMPMDIQSFTITFDDLTADSAVIGFLWEKSYVGVKFEVPTDKKATASIERTMAGPSANDMYSSAVYYLESGKDLNKAKEWMDKAIALRKAADKDGNEPFWMVRQKSLLHAKMGDKKGAIKAAKRSLELAEKAGNADYVAMNKKSLAEWMQ
ncbi:MAG: DUF2911 domain-containing protein [Flavobacteriaceae bacterium]|nr:DUF2911 domain-containing protein [Bacteroidia bacterium]NND11370.1 DUF2911 domain-containing protein [Flavobacteriaceae bacterium]NNK26933.1 DUF2911 domain-containing protein [Flavobacteriaceae bacterium]NNL61023.1 DUF2911 domain-containing protein [Flavobacteriaceae bacterium]